MSKFIFKSDGTLVITSDKLLKCDQDDIVVDFTNERMNPDSIQFQPYNEKQVLAEEPCGEWQWCEMYPKSCDNCPYQGW